MQRSAVYDLMVAKPHEPADARFTAEQFTLYRTGYSYALLMALKAMQAAAERHKARVRTRRLETRQARA